MTKKYKAKAVRWAGGWELHIEGQGVTQVTTLAKAEQQVRDYVETLRGIDTTDAEVSIEPDIGPVRERARKAREKTAAASEAQAEAAKAARQVAKELRSEGLSVADTAAVLGVSKGRVSQLTK